MSKDDFARRAQEIYDRYNGEAGEEGHMDMDDLMAEALRELGYDEGMNILSRMHSVWYA